MARKGDIKMPNFELSHIGTPVADKTFAEGSVLVDIGVSPKFKNWH